MCLLQSLLLSKVVLVEVSFDCGEDLCNFNLVCLAVFVSLVDWIGFVQW